MGGRTPRGFAASLAVTAVLTLTAAGCADDGGSSADDRPSNVHATATQPASVSAAPPSASAPPSSAPPSSAPPTSAKPSASASASGTGKATTRPPSATGTKPRTSAPAGGPDAKFQGTWYYPVRDATGAVLTLTVSGGSIAVSMKGDSCSGRISATAYVTMTCKGDTGRGQASVSGQTLTIAWEDDAAEQFVRTKP